MAEAHSGPCQTWKIEHFAKYFITRILSRTFFNASKIYMNIIKANTGKNAFGKTIYTNWNNKIQQKYEYYCCFPYVIFELLQSNKNFKQREMHSQNFFLRP